MRRLQELLPLAVRFGLGLSARGFEVVAKFGLYALGAHALGVTDAGVFFLCLSLLHLLSTAARLGTERPLSRYVASYVATGEHDLAGRVARSGLRVAALASVTAGVLLCIAAPLAAEVAFHDPGLVTPLRLLACILPGHVLAYACGNILIGLDRSASAQLLTNAAAPAVVFIAMLLGVKDLGWVLAIYGGAYWVCFGVAAVLARTVLRAAPVSEASTPARPQLPPLLAEARAFYVVELALAAFLAMPVLVLARFAQPEQVTEFSVANRLSMLVATLVLSMATMIAPRLAAHHRLGEIESVRRTVRQVTWASLAVCLPAIAAMALLREPLLGLMGVRSPAAEAALLWMLAAQLLVAALPARDTLLAMSGRGHALRNLSLAQAGVGAATCFLLIPHYGVLGAAWSTAIAWMVGVAGCSLVARASLRPTG